MEYRRSTTFQTTEVYGVLFAASADQETKKQPTKSVDELIKELEAAMAQTDELGRQLIALVVKIQEIQTAWHSSFCPPT